MIPYGRQDISQADIDAVISVLQSDFLTQGPIVPLFETTIAKYCRAKHGVAVNSATSALHVACRALGLKHGDRLWTSPNSFVASANCGRYCGATVDFVDIDPGTYNMSVECLKKKLEKAEKEGGVPKIVIPVHFAGQPCEMATIGALAEQYGFSVIEDASHAIGAKYRGEPVGNNKYSDITVFSFHAVKIITTGEGGLATTNDPHLAEAMRQLRSHGITRDVNCMHDRSEGSWYYEQISLGFNYRMTELQAALGLSQFSRLTEFINVRHVIAEKYDVALSSMPLELPQRIDGCRSSLHLYPIQVARPEKRRRVFNILRDAGVGVNVHYIPIHLQPDYKKFGFRRGSFPNAELYYDRAISLPIYPTLGSIEQDQVISELGVALEANEQLVD